MLNPPELSFGLSLSRRMPMPGCGMPAYWLPAAFQQMSGVFQTGLGELGAAQHTGDLLRSLGVVHAADFGLCASALLGLFNQEVLIPEGGDLG
jgi:hypothetical protein